MSVRSYISQLEKDIAASLWLKPATLDELMDREFLANIADFNVDRILFNLENRKWVYYHDSRYHTYKKTVTDHLKDYDLE